MTKQLIIERTLKVINLLPNEKAIEISDFADFILKRYEEQLLTNGIQKVVSESHSFDFLQNEADAYTLSDVKVEYNAKG
jgi:hypothetical protein